MKVLVNGFAVRTGGPETFLFNLLSHLAPIDPSIEYVLLFPESRRALYEDLPGNVILEPVCENTATSTLKRLTHEHISVPRRFFRDKFKVYFQADELLSPVIGMLRVPSLVIFHATQHMLIPQTVGDGPLKLFYLRLMKALSMRLVAIPVTVSYHTKGELSGLYPFASEKIQVIYHGIDFNRFKPQQNPTSILQKKYGIGDYILSVSNRHVFKNYYNLIRAYHLLCERYNIIEKLVIVGGIKSEAEEKRISSYINENNLSGRVHLIDYIAQANIASVYQSAKAYVFPSTFETFGFTPLEAMACGIPCAVSRFSCIPEVCGDAAEYFDPHDVEDIARAIKFILFDEQRRMELMEIGRKHVKQFTWYSAAEKYYNLLLKLSKRRA